MLPKALYFILLFSIFLKTQSQDLQPRDPSGASCRELLFNEIDANKRLNIKVFKLSSEKDSLIRINSNLKKTQIELEKNLEELIKDKSSLLTTNNFCNETIDRYRDLCINYIGQGKQDIVVNIEQVNHISEDLVDRLNWLRIKQMNTKSKEEINGLTKQINEIEKEVTIIDEEMLKIFKYGPSLYNCNSNELNEYMNFVSTRKSRLFEYFNVLRDLEDQTFEIERNMRIYSSFRVFGGRNIYLDEQMVEISGTKIKFFKLTDFDEIIFELECPGNILTRYFIFIFPFSENKATIEDQLTRRINSQDELELSIPRDQFKRFKGKGNVIFKIKISDEYGNEYELLKDNIRLQL